MKLFVTVIGLVLVLESIPYIASPVAMQRWLRQIVATNPEHLRVMALLALGLGIILCFIAQRSTLFG